MKLVLAALALAAAAYLASRSPGESDAPPLPYEEYRAPVQNPPLEPDRPDLIEEPRIDEQQR